jgi:hypothetical protein
LREKDADQASAARRGTGCGGSLGSARGSDGSLIGFKCYYCPFMKIILSNDALLDINK